MHTFETGKTYSGTFITDADSHIEFEIISRTAKTVSFYNPQEREIVRRKISIDSDGAEYFKPFGNYSMALTITAK